ncbi:aminotransferase class III-fold pyridoxal phosphate-dependent enzyme [Agrobacterium vitis]|uniref:Aminotransferase class III-fold pyridoxal phosphate-dependent enzyme n=1 Tax=Agrobacterium vitis TaxID=373 RepID=A0A6L6VLS2_AGRVI|nr:aminotransferase class III-fold pyridoxal phosphate-dependent enzyme [Agrobacterium vitis]MUZ75838.1 aminotransferase class III-fold pyridoxal phosphate-dependent enzyme [Agrobacterium vitis]MVA22750.1 aminotransferase class III-fold pyridoxal phosphate-dependent enzyme [Agrobacterium vitis]
MTFHRINDIFTTSSSLLEASSNRCRRLEAAIEHGVGSELFDVSGRRYIDFTCGTGGLSFGHNLPAMKAALTEYFLADGIADGAGFRSASRAVFMQTLEEIILAPRKLNYKIHVPAPTRANALHDALSLARRVTGRRRIAVVGEAKHCRIPLILDVDEAEKPGGQSRSSDFVRLPYSHLQSHDFDAVDFKNFDIIDIGNEAPAAFLVDAFEARDLMQHASPEWLLRLEELARRLGALLIVDENSGGMGATGEFFAFEGSGIRPDIVLLSGSLSGFGLPIEVVLIHPGIDQFEDLELSATSVEPNLAFITSNVGLRLWQDASFQAELRGKIDFLDQSLTKIVSLLPAGAASARGIGMVRGLATQDRRLALLIIQRAYENGLLVETFWEEKEVVKIAPALTMPSSLLAEAMLVFTQAAFEVISQ